MDSETRQVSSYVLFTGLCSLTEVFGIGTNIINIICFVKQGFNEPVNVSLLGLALSDLASLITLMLASIMVGISVSTTDLTFDAMGLYYLAAALPHLTFTRVTSWITAIITLEKTLCVIAPLKVKRIFTPKRTAAIIVCIFLVIIFSISPMYVANQLVWKFYPDKNKSIFSLTFTEDREDIDNISLVINNFTMPFAAFVLIIICTTLLVICLQKREGWLQSVTNSANNEFSLRNRRVSKMVVIISALFIVCFVPCAVISLSVVFEPEINVGGKYVNIGIILAGVGVLLESINSSGNIFIYYLMSSKYRETFHVIFKVNRIKNMGMF